MQTVDPYDAVTYPSLPNPDTHPDRLAALAVLHGLSPTPVDRCRVLEVACNEGANIIPMAYALPNSEFVGFDLASLPIERGQQRIRALGLTNIRLIQRNILDIGPELGQFDYIIAHGFYSWVPEPVREALMSLCDNLLAPSGVAFISYNALPGSHIRKMTRDIMLFEAECVEDPTQRVAGAFSLLRFVAESRPTADPYRHAIEEQLKRMEKRNAAATFHDELSGAYHPVLFSQFIQQAQQHNLQYLSESTLPSPTDPSQKPEVRAAVEARAPGDILQQEQLLDFLRARMYRETLLCREGHPLRRDFPLENFRRLHFASKATSSPCDTPGAIRFTLPGGIRMEANHPAVLAVLLLLESVWPSALTLHDLEPALAKAGFDLEDDGVALLTRLTVARMIELRTWHAPVASGISAHPRASACSRQEIASRPTATTLLHTAWKVEDPVARHFLQLLDGTRDRDALLHDLIAAFPAMPVEELQAGIEPGLITLHRAALLEA